ncbi:hypothetical protein [Burkholderia sp. NRF60-BP8]|uniref:hypothetical protein n=1 Tax=Burkholderia sp. NRF60-BP8 TaxID=1637853 RepID=UPI000758E7A3|nr:hypothetical protein [Burkholderia sp. NRF60-BP8]AOI80942.1 hypothetical protein WS54_30675 [Burkholderia sp. NRF60-BP8]KVA10561.1 hypothetical protein WS54_18135 [Burkholderia sp. NRF60-BP8]
MCISFRSLTAIVCLGFAASVFAQTTDDSAANGTNCRAVVAQADIDGTEQQIVGRACLQDDGTWQIVQNADGSVLWYPVAAYPYADPWYWGPPLFIGAGVSFIFVDRFRRFHHFDHVDHFNPIGHRRFGVPMGAGFHHGPFPVGAGHGLGGMRRH